MGEQIVQLVTQRAFNCYYVACLHMYLLEFLRHLHNFTIVACEKWSGLEAFSVFVSISSEMQRKITASDIFT